MEHSYLLSLPKELRLEIWQYVLTDPSIDKLVLRICRKAHGPSLSSTRFSNSLYKTTRTALPLVKTAFETRRSCSINLNLLVTSHFVYEEALPILYQSVKFCPQDQGGILPLFLQGLSPFAQSHLHYIKLYIRHCNNSPFYWAIICSEIARLDKSLREIEIEGDWPLTTNFRKKRAILCPLLKLDTPKRFTPAHNAEFQLLLLDAARDRDARAALQQDLSISTSDETKTEATESVTPIESRKREHSVQEMAVSKKTRWDGTPPGTPKTTATPTLNMSSVIERFDGEIVEWDLISMDSCPPNLAIHPESMVSNSSWTRVASSNDCNNDNDGDDDDNDSDSGSEDWEFISTSPNSMPHY